ncbi:methyl-accepting chemotaxis protein [Fuscovulum ytuae]|uniref:Methyl-accepting chemotaxis protein n=1 Tax=Fuscovulum ytuae TaxID=3042299 RepID=A0ABY8Q6N2_9RHOB|nr:methyl-accepting chemotaxis protein [Fuscovulum sp. YMD61]WGV16226.1 methyl-accepting chemotaxis protein [Fuscovulum sp. YMD61]
MMERSSRRIRFSVFGKCLAMIVLLTVIVAGSITYKASELLRDVAMEGLQALAYDSTRSTAREVAGAIKFGKTELIDTVFADLEARAADKLSSAVAFGADFVPRTQAGEVGDADLALATTLAEKALASGQVEVAENGLLIASPALFGEKGDVAGVVVTRWSSAEMEAKAEAQLMRVLWLAAAILGVLLAGAAWFLHRTLSVPLKAITQIGRRVAEGDLTEVVKQRGSDEIAQLQQTISEMVESLRGVVGNVAFAIDGVTEGSAAIASSSTQLSQSASVQAAATEQVSAAVEQMTANIQHSAENASQTEKIAAQSAQDAQKSGQAVADAMAAMARISERIGVVQEIARQTDLLALNAAVEAARAGENGRGFAVVAAEVRKLAEKSQSSASEISDLAGETLRMARMASEMLQRLVPAIQETSQLVTGLSANARELSIGTTQIATAIQSLDSVTQQNTAASESLSSSAVELSAQAEQVRGTIGYFHLDAPGGEVVSEAEPVHTPPPARMVVDMAEPQRAAA